jgi:hypothetical protein
MPAAGTPRWLLVVGAPPAGEGSLRTGLREALRAGRAAREPAPGTGAGDSGNDGRGTALEER